MRRVCDAYALAPGYCIRPANFMTQRMEHHRAGALPPNIKIDEACGRFWMCYG